MKEPKKHYLGKDRKHENLVESDEVKRMDEN